MGWGFRVGLFVLGIVAASFGAWIITIPILAFLFLPPLFAKRRSLGQRGWEPKAEPKRGSLPVRKIAGAILLLLSLVAVSVGGTLSPIVLAVLGFLVLLRPDLGSRFLGAKPVEDSILLRGEVNPFKWFALAEAKISTRDPTGALSGVSERLLLLSTPAPRMFFVFFETSVRRSGAEERIIRRMQAVARALSPLGVYLLPLDSKEALEASTLADRMDTPEGSLQQNLSSADYGSALMEARNGVVSAFELRARHEGKRRSSALGRPKERPRATIFLREFLQAAAQRMGTPQPDRYVTFLSSMAATEGETLGQRITQMVEGPGDQALQVASLSGPSVELSRAQLRAITRVYE